MSSVMIAKVDVRSNTELPMKKARSGLGPPCPNFFSCSCLFSVDWQHNSCLPTCFIPDIDDVCSALLLAAAACQCPSVRHLVWPFAVMSALLTVFALEEGEGGREFRGRPPNHYNELPLRNVIPTTQEAPLPKVGSLSPFAQILSGSGSSRSKVFKYLRSILNNKVPNSLPSSVMDLLCPLLA